MLLGEVRKLEGNPDTANGRLLEVKFLGDDQVWGVWKGQHQKSTPQRLRRCTGGQFSCGTKKTWVRSIADRVRTSWG